MIINGKLSASAKEWKPPEEIKNLYATSACLMDGESGRVLFEKNADEVMPMASTTKIMTCIVTLENADLSDVVTISPKAARQPDVQLHVNTGETYWLKDLLYSLMLESHNDAAVAIAEHVGGSVENFAKMMNKKSMEIGCKNTYFITPNGLDSSDQNGIHGTTAKELALIMSYCILKSEKANDFLEITQREAYTFHNIEGSRSFSCYNHNAFLKMMEGVLSGKTGFTAKAGYCYVGALEQNGKKLIVSLLACGWPNHKTYKWSDTRKLMEYGLKNYSYRRFDEITLDENKLRPISVKNGQTPRIGETAKATIRVLEVEDKAGNPDKILMREDEKMEVVYHIKKELTAPVKKMERIGTIQYLIDGKTWETKPVVISNTIEKVDFLWCVQKIRELFFL
ncbi:MAG: D-alanyl-D-alanine carboxypeptidase family protein [Acetivibrio sp.]